MLIAGLVAAILFTLILGPEEVRKKIHKHYFRSLRRYQRAVGASQRGAAYTRLTAQHIPAFPGWQPYNPYPAIKRFATASMKSFLALIKLNGH